MPDHLPSGTGKRVVIEKVEPTIDGGRFAVKRIVGELITVTADVFADGHDVVLARLRWRHNAEPTWNEVPMTDLGNDAWQASFTADELGTFEFTVIGWVDAFETWRRDLEKRLRAGQDVGVDLQIGAQIVARVAERAAAGKGARASAVNASDAARLREFAKLMATGGAGLPAYQAGAGELSELAARYPDLRAATECERPFAVTVDPPKARYSTWYELFPRSCAPEPGRHGTFADCIEWLPRLADLGFDVLYLPPIHPIGTTFRKGKNNNVVAQPDDVGSPWGIGSPEGGHKAIHRELGTLADLQRLITAAAERGIDVALDIAFQCSPDHPYVREHPRWFRQRPDGRVQYAENPPKKYQDIYPFDFETSDWQALWRELTDVFLYWARHGIRIFRVDNPHTKPFEFWEYLIGEVKGQYPDVILLSEAFTRPKVMYRLAKLGFTQSYTYFTWRTGKAELSEYFTELTQSPVREFFRPNLWPNTPDILTAQLQRHGRPEFIARLVLAATLGANYGIYGPAYETLEHVPREPGSEEYLNSEKYELRYWDFAQRGALGDVIASVNRIRRENPALQSDHSLRFHSTDSEGLICYSKRHAESGNAIVVVVNVGLPEVQSGFVELDLAGLGLDPSRPLRLDDLLGGTTFYWQGARNFVKLDPAVLPAHVFRVSPA
jgi:starch synthase (maltosyl-transferring)